MSSCDCIAGTRSLARSAMRRKDYGDAAKHFDRALILNPLHPEIWFSLGFCYLKIEDIEGALKVNLIFKDRIQ